MTRRILQGIAPLRFGEGRECTFPAVLAAATKSEYDWVMGCSGAAFATRIDAKGWDPLAASPRDPETMARGARAAGVRLDAVPPPYDDELRELVLARIVEAIDDGVPPLVRGVTGPPEFGLLIGYDTDGPTFFARTYFDKGREPTRMGWEAFEDEERGTPIFLDRAGAPAPVDAAREGIAAGLAAGQASDLALRSWIDALRDDARWSDARHAGSAAFADHAMRTVLADERRAAARFLRGTRGHFPPRAGADLLRAAEAYGHVGDAAEKAGTGPFDATIAMRFLDPGQRRGWANLLEGALRYEHDAREAMASAHATMRPS